MAEQVFLEAGSVVVTSSRIVIDNKTYAVSGITAVWKEENSLDYGELIMKAIFGVFLLLIPTIGAIIEWLMFVKEYKILLSTASGEIVAYQSQNAEFVDRIIKAINEAIIARQ